MSASGAVAGLENRPAHWLANFSATDPPFILAEGAGHKRPGRYVFRLRRDRLANEWAETSRVVVVATCYRCFHRLPVKTTSPKGVAIVRRLFILTGSRGNDIFN